MNIHRAHTEILILAVASVLVLLVSVSFKAPQAKLAEPQATSQTRFQPAAAAAVTQASLQIVSAQQATGDWVRAEAVDAPVRQTRWVF
ncbi:hypothetical protein SAMN05216588_12199 [Pseudomonas flavescens]|uniref:Uncharacterized protein n=1 Tax=Phytopseudomonas flavescens TaxID=29435 RepID=A0A1G8MGP0_9GAMM|nr:hypothetical protein [Pseudomonas flavescens]SDI67134.1 hypothetical protein SAMN05216588_12199 [Pseudomonas flavescens]